jgi:hypothetical protein
LDSLNEHVVGFVRLERSAHFAHASAPADSDRFIWRELELRHIRGLGPKWREKHLHRTARSAPLAKKGELYDRSLRHALPQKE